MGQLLVDGQPQPRATVLACGGTIGLNEGLKQFALSVCWNTDAGIPNEKPDARAFSFFHDEGNAASFCEFESIREIIVENLL